MNSPVYTTPNACQDCYKCVRHCPVKAIRITDGAASVIPESCVACGECVKVCPVQAKKIRNDLPRLKALLASGARVVASIAPSFTGYFPGVTIARLAGALKAAGFAGVSETAHGAELVSAGVRRLFADAPKTSVLISSACPACVDFIRLYRPDWTDRIAPLPSPVLAHAARLKETQGEDVKVVFFGPCAAKKNEADRMPHELALALTFASLEEFLAERGIDPAACPEGELTLGPAHEGRFYCAEGGMNDTLRDGRDIRYLAVSGLEGLKRLLAAAPPDKETEGRSVFIECLACPGGCVNGPATRGADLATLMATDAAALLRASEGCAKLDYASYVRSESGRHGEKAHTEIEIAEALARIGKFTKMDEVNCGACGYESCRAFARAMLEGKAEEAMCHTYLKRNFERTSNALIKYIPAGVVLVGPGGAILECNRRFAELAGAGEEYDARGNLDGMDVGVLLPEFADLFAGALEHGSEVERFRQPLKGRLVNISVFPIVPGESAGAVVQDVTRNELKREQIAAKAREVIHKNVLTVQEVARLFGEHIAESETLLNDIAGSYESKTEGVSYNGGDSEDYLNG